jgi:hypothetical protein
MAMFNSFLYVYQRVWLLWQKSMRNHLRERPKKSGFNGLFLMIFLGIMFLMWQKPETAASQ